MLLRKVLQTTIFSSSHLQKDINRICLAYQRKLYLVLCLSVVFGFFVWILPGFQIILYFRDIEFGIRVFHILGFIYYNMVEECTFSGCVQQGILVAGDSNVHRILRVVTDQDDVFMNCLPVSGARFTRDRKKFREMLRTELVTKMGFTRMYLHLGSNDALNCSDEEFYKDVTEVLDLVHDTSQEMEIVVCEIPPRGPDRRRYGTLVPGQRLKFLQRWIGSANRMLKEICDHTPYARFLSYGRFMASRHLFTDGLHLNRSGAEWCYHIIAEDNINHQCIAPKRSKQEIDYTEGWPMLGDFYREEQAPLDIPFADIVRTSTGSADSRVVNKDERKTKVSRNIQRKQLMQGQLRQTRSGRQRFEQARSRWIKKKFVRNAQMRSLHHPYEYVVLKLTDHVAVEIPACQLSGPCLKKAASSKPDRIQTEKTRPKTRPNSKKEHVQVWQMCPEKGCSTICSTDHFLMDHIIKRHVSNFECVEPASIDQQKSTMPFVLKGKFQNERETLGENKEKGHYVDSKGKPDIVVAEFVEDILDTSSLQLMLANDVELNPGPVFSCGWENCAAAFETYQQCESHALGHATEDDICRWTGCQGYCTNIVNQRMQHVTRHIYDNEEWFQTLKDCGVVKVGEELPMTTNLFTVPKHLRSELKLLLFDENFLVEDNCYSKEKHREYLFRECLLNPSNFKKLRSNFISKRTQLGEDWSSYFGPKHDGEKVTTLLPNEPSLVHRSELSFSSSDKYSFVETTRPELSSDYYSGTNLKSNARKRKHKENLDNTEKNCQSWFQIMIHNLKICNQAIKYQKHVLDKIIDIVDAKNQKFFKIEQETAKLSACTAGTFVCFVFKCMINEKEVYYIRYVESGCFSGFMTHKHMDALKAIYQFSDENCLLHNVITNDDLEDKTQVKDDKTVKRSRPDKLLKRSFQEVLPKPVSEVKKLAESCDVEGLQLESYIITIWPFPQQISVDNPEKPYLEVSSSFCSSKFKDVLVDFRTNRPKMSVVKSKDIFGKKIARQLTLFKQSLFLNCLSDDTKRNSGMYKRPGKFDANFLKSPWQASSLRSYILSSYLNNDLHNLSSFLVKYFPDLTDPEYSSKETPTTVDSCKVKRNKTVEITKTVHVSKDTLRNKLKSKESDQLEDTSNKPITLFDSFCFNLLHHGRLSIQAYDGFDVVCCMNNYNEINGSFKECDFVYTTKLRQETGDHYFCTCGTYSTLLEIDNSSNSDLVVLDAVKDNCVTCMHCKFLKLKIIPYLESEILENESDIDRFVCNALKDKGKELVELCRRNETRKFSIFIEDENPSLVHLTYNRGIGKHIISCMNGECLSKKGHKKNVEKFRNAIACKHLSVIQNHAEFWQDLENKEASTSIDLESISNDMDCDIYPVPVDELPINAEYITVNQALPNSEKKKFFDDETGLWHFKCKSTHKPNAKGSATLKLNVKKRDMWNDSNLKRDEDGCLIGPSLFPDIPDNTCGCGSGWLKRDDDDNYNENGLIMNENNRVLIVYTSSSPVKCKIHTRICYNQSSPCKIVWDEGSLEAIHVLSRDTGVSLL